MASRYRLVIDGVWLDTETSESFVEGDTEAYHRFEAWLSEGNKVDAEPMLKPTNEPTRSQKLKGLATQGRAAIQALALQNAETKKLAAVFADTLDQLAAVDDPLPPQPQPSTPARTGSK